MSDVLPNLRIERPAESIPEMVVRRVRQAILEGDLIPGRRLTERELMELTGVSRTSIREAVRNLQSLGLVETSESRGVRVAVLDGAEVREIYEVRAALEPMAAALFVERATDEEINEIAAILGGPYKDDEDQLTAIFKSDQLMLAGARNALLESILSPLHARIHALRRLSLTIPGRRDSSHQEYLELVQAMKDRSTERASELALAHVERAKTAALDAVKRFETIPER